MGTSSKAPPVVGISGERPLAGLPPLRQSALYRKCRKCRGWRAAVTRIPTDVVMARGISPQSGKLGIAGNLHRPTGAL